jgi:hypothetical protein
MNNRLRTALPIIAGVLIGSAGLTAGALATPTVVPAQTSTPAYYDAQRVHDTRYALATLIAEADAHSTPTGRQLRARLDRIVEEQVIIHVNCSHGIPPESGGDADCEGEG